MQQLKAATLDVERLGELFLMNREQVHRAGDGVGGGPSAAIAPQLQPRSGCLPNSLPNSLPNGLPNSLPNGLPNSLSNNAVVPLQTSSADCRG